MRAFSDGRSVVLVDLPRPCLVDDHALAKHGIRELHLWSPELVAGPEIAVPPPLRSVFGLRQVKIPPTMRIAGVVLSGSSNEDYGWLHALSRMGTLPRPTTAADGAATYNAIVALFSEAR